MWYKRAKDFSKRNRLHYKINYLENLLKKINDLKDMVFQSGTVTKQEIEKIIYDNKISSYPKIRDMIIDMHSNILDSPTNFKAKAIILSSKIQKLIDTIKKGDQQNEDKKGWIV